MALASPLAVAVPQPSTEAIEGAAEVQTAPIRLRIHDAARVEWGISIPFPDHGKRPYSIEVELEIPSSAVAQCTPWEQLQTMTRLDGPSRVSTSPNDATIDTLRRAAISLTQRLKLARDGFERHLGEAMRKGAGAELQDPDFVGIWLRNALQAARSARAELTRPSELDTPLSRRERALIDEFVSVALLEVLADADARLQRAAAEVARSEGPVARAVATVARSLDDAVKDEIEYRERRGFQQASPSSPVALERYVARTARLKKHFEEVLFLDRETSLVDERVRAWMSLVAALVAGSVAFGMQLFLNGGIAKQHLGAGVLLLALLAGVAYAVRDRMKEAARAWLTGKAYRYHAQRRSRCRIPERRDGVQDVVVEAREWCNQTTRSAPDPLSPESGASLRETLVSYVHRGVIVAHPLLAGSGVQRVRHIFRYDLSPLFARLHDELKRVPVVQQDHRICFVDAPRRYYVPISIKVGFEDQLWEERATIVLDKRGLKRLDASAEHEAAEPSEAGMPLDL